MGVGGNSWEHPEKVAERLEARVQHVEPSHQTNLSNYLIKTNGRPGSVYSQKP